MSTEAATATAEATATPTQTTQAATTQQTTAAVQPFYSDFLRADGTINHSSLDRLPDHLKGLKDTWSRAKTVEDLGMMHLNSMQLNGKKALAPLPADAPAHVQTERKQLMDTLNGVPTTPKDYGITRPQDFPENAWSQPAADNLAAWAHKHSVSPAAAKELMQTHGKQVEQQLAAQHQEEQTFWKNEQSAFEAQIRQDNIPADRANALVEKGAQALGLDMTNEQTKLFLQGKDARMMALRHALAIGEGATVQANGSAPATPDPEAAAKDITSNPANPLFAAFWNKDGKFSREAHDAAVEKRNQLLRMSTEKPAGAKR